MKGKVQQQVPAHTETINNPRKQRKTTWLRRDSNPEPPLTWRLRYQLHHGAESLAEPVVVQYFPGCCGQFLVRGFRVHDTLAITLCFFSYVDRCFFSPIF